MPNLAFSPGPQQPRAGEKENAIASDTGGNKSATDPSARRRSSGGDGSALGRSPLERLSHDMESSEASSRLATAVPVAAPAVVACKRNSSCKCPDCDMAASVFGIDQLRQVGGGGVARSPVSGGGVPPAMARSPPPAAVVGDGDGGAPAPGKPVDGAVGGGGGTVAAQGEEGVRTPGRPVVAAAAVVVASSGGKKATTPTSAARVTDVKEPGAAAVEQADGGVIAAEGGSGVKKKGWGFRMARAVFSPAAVALTPKSKKKKDAAEESGGFCSVTNKIGTR